MEACLPPRVFSTGVGTHICLVRAQGMLGDPLTRVSGYCGRCAGFSSIPIAEGMVQETTPSLSFRGRRKGKLLPMTSAYSAGSGEGVGTGNDLRDTPHPFVPNPQNSQDSLDSRGAVYIELTNGHACCPKPSGITVRILCLERQLSSG